MSRQDISIAVGSAGSSTGLGVLQSLVKWPQASRLLACDINLPEHVAAASLFPFAQVPPATEADYVDRLIALLQEGGWTSFYPIHDVEISKTTAQHDKFLAAGIRLLAPSSEAVGRVRDKLAMADILLSAGIPSPATTGLDHAIWRGRRMHCKPRSGVGSQGAMALTDEAALKARQSAPDAANMIAQPFVEGIEVTVDIFCGDVGVPLGHCCRERLETKAGVCTKGRLFEDDALAVLGRRLSEALGLNGAFCFQVRGGLSPNDWQVIDVNPRVGGATPMSVAVGRNFALAHAAWHCGFDPREFFAPLPEGDIFVTRSYQEHVSWPQNR